MTTGDYYHLYCLRCGMTHWVRVTGTGREICDHQTTMPTPGPGQYSKRAPRYQGQTGISIRNGFRAPAPIAMLEPDF